MKLEVKAASKGHREEGDHLAEVEGAEKVAPPPKELTREKGRKNPEAPPLAPVDLAMLAKKEKPATAPGPAPAPPSKETVRERLAAALRGELTRSMTLKKDDGADAKAVAAPIAKPVAAPLASPVAAPVSKPAAAPLTKPATPAVTPAPAPAAKPSAPDMKPAVQAQTAPAAPPHQTVQERREPTKSRVVPPSPAPKMESKEAAKAPDASPDKPAAASPTPPKRPMQVRFTGMKPMHVVEAALFSVGKPVSVEEIAETTGLPPESVKQGIKDLQKDYAARDTVLEVGKAGAKWGMQVKQVAAEPAAKFAPMEIAPKLLKTLALIAYHQPLKQSELVDMIGTKVYDHVPELVERGLVRSREEGVTKILTTTAAFPEYFGLDAAGPEEVRKVMGKLVGITAPPKKTAEESAAAAEAAKGDRSAAPADTAEAGAGGQPAPDAGQSPDAGRSAAAAASPPAAGRPDGPAADQ